ncbi:MAG: trigger factor, partial [Actinomycetaceae bacterium]
MKTDVENLEATRAKLTVTVPYEELSSAIESAYATVSQQVSIPGFRKGKVPARIIDQRVGRAAVLDQAINSQIETLYRDAVTESGLNPLGRPEIEVTELPAVTGPLGGQLVFSASMDVRPEIELPDFSAITLT